MPGGGCGRGGGGRERAGLRRPFAGPDETERERESERERAREILAP